MSEKQLTHQRAKYAHECIKNVPNNLRDKYKTQAMDLRNLIYRAGLLQTLAYYCSKLEVSQGIDKKPHFTKISLHLLTWILHGKRINNIFINRDSHSWAGNKQTVLDWYSELLNASDEEIMYYTQEALALADWLRRFADAELG